MVPVNALRSDCREHRRAVELHEQALHAVGPGLREGLPAAARASMSCTPACAAWFQRRRRISFWTEGAKKMPSRVDVGRRLRRYILQLPRTSSGP
jgi:hypothetical protein